MKQMLVAAVVLTLINVGCSKQQNTPSEPDVQALDAEKSGSRKNVILIVADSLQSDALEEGIKQKKLPTFQYLMEHGQFYPDFVSSFPTMSVTIDGTLLTGAGPDAHHVPGLVWYSAEEGRLINYGTGPVEMIKYGLDPLVWNALHHLNGRHLNANTPTIFEELADRGLTSGSVNGLIYRGRTRHTLTIPAWLDSVSSLPREIEVRGPDFLAYGALSNPLEGIAELPDGLMKRFGFNDEYAIETAAYLIKKRRLPDFLYVYLPEMDRTLHKEGPSVLDGIERLDRKLNTLLKAFGSREEALRRAVIMVMGDSGVTQVLPRSAESAIELGELFRSFNLLQPGGEIHADTDLALALNESMAYVYNLTDDFALRDIAAVLRHDPRIDFAAWKENEWVQVLQCGTGKTLQYKKNGELLDPYRQAWTVKGDPAVLDLRIDGTKLTYDGYPDALNRLASALDSHAGAFLVLTAKPGYEFAFGGAPLHSGGGAHGSLSREDSLVPVLIHGTDARPGNRRIVDLKAYLMKLLSGRK
jgi:hypothetical protein